MLIRLLIESDKTRFYSLARYALSEAIKISNVKEGDTVLIPEYICREIIGSIKENHANVLYYKVNLNLSPLDPPDKWPRAKVVLAVNYFGFPQDLNPFKIYSKLTGAVIIEDNAHGFLSKDGAGVWLGLRTQIGIFSLRKTFSLPDGAAIVVNDDHLRPYLDKQLTFYGKGFSRLIEIKYKIKHLPLFGIYLFRLLLFLIRIIRKIRTRHSFPVSVDMDQYVIPYRPNPFKNMLSKLEGIALNEGVEIERRRALYRKTALLINRNKINPIFEDIPKGVAPFGFPFRALEHDAKLFGDSVKSLDLEIIKWPDLPDNISSQEHYNNVWVINFIE